MALILVADDQAEILDICRMHLMGKGHHVMTADDGVQATRIAQEALPKLILTDIHMPNSYGPTVYTVLQNSPRTENIPIKVVVTVEDDAARGSSRTARAAKPRREPSKRHAR